MQQARAQRCPQVSVYSRKSSNECTGLAHAVALTARAQSLLQSPSAAPSAAGRAAAAPDRPRCKFHGCTYYGSLENEWHCSLHFKQMQQQRNAAAPHPVPPAPSAPASMTGPDIAKSGSFSGSADADTVSPSSAPLQPPPQSAHPQCKFHGCTYMGSLENEWHCSVHFQQMQQQRNAAVPHPVPPAPSAPSPAPLQPPPQLAHPSDADEGPSDTVLVSQMRAHSQLLGCCASKTRFPKFCRVMFVMRTASTSPQLTNPQLRSNPIFLA